MKLIKNISLLQKIGIAAALFGFVIHFFLMETKWHEYRQTFECSSEDYSGYKDNMKRFESDGVHFQANWESLGDSLVKEGIRRFELRVFTKSDKYSESGADTYFKHHKMEIPKTVSISNFGSSKPLGRSLGVALLVYLIFLILELSVFRKKAEASKAV